MKCPEIKNLLPLFLDSGLSQREMLIVEAHLHQCAACRREKELLEQTWSMLDKVQPPPISPHFTRDLMARIDEEKEAQPGWEWSWPQINVQFGFRVLAPVMAMICIAVLVYSFVQNPSLKGIKVAKQMKPAWQTALPVAPASHRSLQMASSKAAPAVEQKKTMKLAANLPSRKEEAQSHALDEEIIRHLGAYQNAEFYENYAVVSNLDVIENAKKGTL